MHCSFDDEVGCMKSKIVFLILGIAIFYVFERGINSHIVKEVEKKDYFITSMINENLDVIKSKNIANKNSIFCKSKSMLAYYYALCFRFILSADNKMRYKLQDNDLIRYDFIAPRPIISFSRLLWQNHSYLNYKSPFGRQVGFVKGNGTWILLDWRQGENDTREQYNKPLIGNSNRVIKRKGTWGKTE